MRPPSFRPIVVMNRPMPTPIARFRSIGMAFMTASRRPVITSSRMMRPSTKITDMPTCQGTLACWKPMTENVTTAFRPMPDASANGRLRDQAHADAHERRAECGRGRRTFERHAGADRMPGFTKMM